MFCDFMEQVIARTDEGQVRFETFNTKVPQLPPQNSTNAQQMNVLFGNQLNRITNLSRLAVCLRSKPRQETTARVKEVFRHSTAVGQVLGAVALICGAELFGARSNPAHLSGEDYHD